jgi:hypothetical protein
MEVLKQRASEAAAAFYYQYKEMLDELRDLGMEVSDRMKLLHFIERLRDSDEIAKMRPGINENAEEFSLLV